MRSNTNQIILILSGLIVTALFGVFLYRELFPEYKIYQNDYVALEEFRSTYTKQPMPEFRYGIKQIVQEREDKGNPVIDRCTSCHVALQIPYFSPTKIAYDINGNILRDEKGWPIKFQNEDYIWDKLDQKIEELKDEKVNAQLRSEGQEKEVNNRLKQAHEYEALKTAHVDDYVYDVTKVLAMHPLIGKETRPFEFHPIEEYGCTSCHSGNGRGLVTDKAHGPVVDEQYEKEIRPTPQFTEADPANDPLFARVFNSKPGHSLLFQTEPIFVGGLVEAKCIQCHQTSQKQFEEALSSASDITKKKESRLMILQKSFEEEKETLISLIALRKQLVETDYPATLQALQTQTTDYSLSDQQRRLKVSQLAFLKKAASPKTEVSEMRVQALNKIDRELAFFVGSPTLVEALSQDYAENGANSIDRFLKEHQQDEKATGSLFAKAESIDYQQDLLRHVRETEKSFQSAVDDQKTTDQLTSDIDELTRHYQHGEELFLSQACYACHRISGFARGGVGPELSKIGYHYPWYIKESIVWPQADLQSSTMPNMRLDHEELEDLVTFLLAQRGNTRAVAQTAYQADLQSWEAGRKLPWEKPVSPTQMHDLRYGMTTFTVEGCASCHRLEGFDSNVGFRVEQEVPDKNRLYEEQEWFKKLFPETVNITSGFDESLNGSALVEIIEKHADEIDERIVDNVRKDSILEEIEKGHPGSIEALYTGFKFANRAKNQFYDELEKQERDEEKKKTIRQQKQQWKERVHRVLMMYIQQYGLGRLIGPHLNWSGVFRTDEWLMEHFKNPTSHVPRSIMPVFPFDETKFYALTYMLDVLGIRNRDAARQIWSNRGFDPAAAYQLYCAQCHGLNLQGNGPVSEWIYPIPKSLRSSDFMRNLTKERAIYSIMHGVKGTPMPGWSDIGGDKPTDIQQVLGNKPVLTRHEVEVLVDWLFSSLSGGEILKHSEDAMKWHYQPQDVLEELKNEGGYLRAMPDSAVPHIENKDLQPADHAPLPVENNPPVEPDLSAYLPTGEGYYASLTPLVSPKASSDLKRKELEIEDVFEKYPNESQETGPDAYRYYIKKKYYTPYNIEEGRKFFIVNCAVCHGNEADGSGVRALAMQEAKPRMLTNLDWIQSKDDLRLLRSIKYGVIGTSMTPWGDLTSSLQRLQLVIFIRSLTEDNAHRVHLDTLLYQLFDTSAFEVEKARVAEIKTQEELQKERQKYQQQQSILEEKVAKHEIDAAQAADNYRQLLQAEQSLSSLQKQDALYLKLKEEIKQERAAYQNMGADLLSKGISEQILNTYFALLQLNAGRYALKEGQLTFSFDSQRQDKIRQLRDQIVQQFDSKIDELQKQKTILEGKLPSKERNDSLAVVQTELSTLQKIKVKILSETETALRSVQKQKEWMEKINSEKNGRDNQNAPSKDNSNPNKNRSSETEQNTNKALNRVNNG